MANTQKQIEKLQSQIESCQAATHHVKALKTELKELNKTVRSAKIEGDHVPTATGFLTGLQEAIKAYQPELKASLKALQKAAK